jgi:ribosomal-protein-alanine N-acetyltransferase
MYEVKTPRMRLISGTRDLAEAELSERGRLAALLNATVPGAWPPETLRDALPLFLSSCRRSGLFGPWTLGWYGILETTGSATSTLCGSVGFKGPPGPQGVVEIGYAVLPDYQRRGLGTEMVVGLSQWALGQSGVKEVHAEVSAENRSSVRVLEKSGFIASGSGQESGSLMFRLSATLAGP